MNQKQASQDTISEPVEDSAAVAAPEAAAGPSMEPVATEPPRSPEQPSIPELVEALELAQRRADEYWNDLLRARAELDNLHKRASRDLANAHKYGLERFITELLPVKDSLELGIAAASQSADIATVHEGMELILKMLTDLLAKNGVDVIAPEGEKFNPERHQAMTLEASPDVEPGTVLSVIQKGYLLNERLLRPAMVIVSKQVTQDKA